MSKDKAKILIVDDDEESRRLLSEVLEVDGYEVRSVGDGKAALEALREDEAYRIIITDLRMPREGGLDLLRDLRKENSKHEIILMSSFITGADRDLAQELGAHALLEKPFRLSDLMERVAELVSKNPIGISS